MSMFKTSLNTYFENFIAWIETDDLNNSEIFQIVYN